MNHVDQLGLIRAQIAELQAQAKALETELKDAGAGTTEGSLFSATVSEVATTRVDWKGIAAKLSPSRQLVTAHTRIARSVRLTITARKRAAA